MPPKTDVDHWEINATVYKDRVEETHYITDPARNIRRRPYTKVWTVQKYLGRGAFGEVRLEKNIAGNELRAVKRIITEGTDISSQQCEREIKALLEFSKPKSKDAAIFVEFFGWFRDGSEIFLAMEYFPRGDLETVLKAHSGKVPEDEAREIIEQVLTGLEMMHAETFAHRDLKPQNILVVHGPPSWWVKLADFGLTKSLTEATAYRTISGTLPYMAPEIHPFFSDGSSDEYTNAVDLWALGCITYRLVTGKVPFPEASLAKYLEDKSLFPYEALFDNEIKSSCAEFTKGLLNTSPSERPPALQALKHPWIILGKARAMSQIITEPSMSEGVAEPSISGSTAKPMMSKNVTERLWVLKEHIGDVSFLDFSLSSKILLSTSWDNTIKLWDVAAGEALYSFSGDARPNIGAILLSDSKVVATTLAGSAFVIDITTSKMFRIFEGYVDMIHTVAVSPDRTIVAAVSQDRRIWLWYGTTGGIMSLTGTGLLNKFEREPAVAFSLDGKVLLASEIDGPGALRWDVATGMPLRPHRTYPETAQVTVFSPDGQLVACTFTDGKIWILDTSTGATIRTHQISTKLEDKWTTLVFSADSKVLAYVKNRYTICLWEITTGKTLRMTSASVQHLGFSPNGKIIASSAKGVLWIWDALTGEALRELQGDKTRVTCVAFSPDSKWFATSLSDGVVEVWKVPTLRKPL